MGNRIDENELFQSSQLVILFSYTFLSVVLAAESLLMSWELWAVILLMVGLVIGWVLHIGQKLNAYSRLWVYTLMTMAAFFFYGTHETSTFDLATVMCIVIMIYTMTGIKVFVSVCQITYYITFIYEMVQIIVNKSEVLDGLFISRSLLHVAMVLMAGIIGKTIISNWDKVLINSKDEIEELKRATERLENFLANVSHEIRTPVNAVIGLSAVLKKEELLDQVTESIDAISRAGHRVSEQIGDILDFTEIDMGKLSVNNENYLIGSLVNDLMAQLSVYGDRGLDLVVDMEADIPLELIGDAGKIKKILWHLIDNGFKFTKEGGVYVHLYPIRREYGINLVIAVKDTGIGIDDDEIEHIYEQFYQSDAGRTRISGGLGLGIPIVNGFVKAMGGVMAIESSVDTGTTVRVSIPQQIVENAPTLSVRDKKNCVAAGFLGFMTTAYPKIRDYYLEMINHLVEGLDVPFFRVQSRNDLEKLLENEKVTHLFVGTGEYLENRDYIDSLIGRMNVAVVMDRGFKGDVSHGISLLPKPFYGVQVATFLNQTLEEIVDLSDEEVTFPDVRALVVDDEPMNIMVAKGILEGYGMVVSSALSGREAIDKCEKEEYDIIFMDHMMPEMDGVEAMKRIRTVTNRKNKELAIVALTANAISSAKEMFLSEGFDGFIPKPIEMSEFERVLKRVLPKNAVVHTIKREGIAVETNESVKAEDDRYALLKKIGVGIGAGIGYCNKDEVFYVEVLKEYASGKEKKLSELASLYEYENWKDYAIRVHAVKSTSKMTGAMELSEMARLLEDAAKKENKTYIIKEHDGFIAKYREFMDVIDKSFGSGDIPDDEKADDGDDDILEFDPEGFE